MASYALHLPPPGSFRWRPIACSPFLTFQWHFVASTVLSAPLLHVHASQQSHLPTLLIPKHSITVPSDWDWWSFVGANFTLVDLSPDMNKMREGFLCRGVRETKSASGSAVADVSFHFLHWDLARHTSRLCRLLAYMYVIDVSSRL